MTSSIIRHELQQLDIDLDTEQANDAWISSNPSSQAILMAAKKQSRFEKKHVFHGFVLERNTNKDEFNDFVRYLDENKHNIPPNTRFQLAVLTKHVDPLHDAYFYDQGIRGGTHWTAVDILVGEDGEVSSFVLDAANSLGFREMHFRLKKMFNKGKHYVYKNDEFNKKERSIQTQEIGCRVFTIEHLKQLSQINSTRLYDEELPQLAVKCEDVNLFSGFKEGEIRPKDFRGGFQLSRIFRSMQSWSALRSLGQDVLSTPIKAGAEPVTLLKAAELQSENVNGVEINNTIKNKNKRYKQKKREFVENLSASIRQKILENRQGFIFLQNPILLKLDKMLARLNINQINEVMREWLVKLQQFAHEYPQAADRFNETILQLKSLNLQTDNLAEIKAFLSLEAASIYQHIATNQSLKLVLNDSLDRIVQKYMPIETIDDLIWACTSASYTIQKEIISNSYNLNGIKSQQDFMRVLGVLQPGIQGKFILQLGENFSTLFKRFDEVFPVLSLLTSENQIALLQSLKLAALSSLEEDQLLNALAILKPEARSFFIEKLTESSINIRKFTVLDNVLGKLTAKEQSNFLLALNNKVSTNYFGLSRLLTKVKQDVCRAELLKKIELTLDPDTLFDECEALLSSLKHSDLVFELFCALGNQLSDLLQNQQWLKLAPKNQIQFLKALAQIPRQEKEVDKILEQLRLYPDYYFYFLYASDKVELWLDQSRVNAEYMIQFLDNYEDKKGWIIKLLTPLADSPIFKLLEQITGDHFSKYAKAYYDITHYIREYKPTNDSILKKWFKYDSDSKKAAAEWLQQVISGKKNYTQEDFLKHSAALSQGRLGKIYHQTKWIIDQLQHVNINTKAAYQDMKKKLQIYKGEPGVPEPASKSNPNVGS